MRTALDAQSPAGETDCRGWTTGWVCGSPVAHGDRSVRAVCSAHSVPLGWCRSAVLGVRSPAARNPTAPIMAALPMIASTVSRVVHVSPINNKYATNEATNTTPSTAAVRSRRRRPSESGARSARAMALRWATASTSATASSRPPGYDPDEHARDTGRGNQADDDADRVGAVAFVHDGLQSVARNSDCEVERGAAPGVLGHHGRRRGHRSAARGQRRRRHGRPSGRAARACGRSGVEPTRQAVPGRRLARVIRTRPARRFASAAQTR